MIPCYNGERCVAEAARSVLDQSFGDLELVIVDDGSTDGSVKACEKLRSDDPRVRLVVHDGNRGIAAARNSGLASSSGAYVGFLDQDDVWLPGKLEAQVAALDALPEGVAMVFSDVEMVGEQGEFFGLAQRGHLPRHLNDLPRQAVFRAFFLHNFIPLISVLVRRSALEEVGGFDESIGGGTDDYELCLRLLSRYRARFMEPPLAVHVVHAGNYSRDIERLLREAPDVAARAIAAHPELERLRARRYAILHARLARYHRDAGDFARARTKFAAAVRADPRWPVPYLLCLLTLGGPVSAGVLGLRRRVRWRLTRRDRRAKNERKEPEGARTE